MSIVLWTLLFVVGLPALAVGGAMVVRRQVGAENLAHHNDVAGFIYAVLGVVYAVLLGFSAIIVWEQYRRAEEGAEREANAVADLYRDAQVFPPAVQEVIAARLRDYVRLVVEKEWPAMTRGEPSEETWEAYKRLWQAYHQYTPADERARIWYAESVERMSVMGDERRSRLLSAHAGVPGVIWVVLLIAGAVTIGFSFLFGTRSARAHGLMTAALAITIGVVLLSIVALEKPFAGMTRVQPEAFEQVQRILGQ